MQHRRGFLAGALACGASAARAQDNVFAAAAAYSAERRGVSLVVMREGRLIYEDYPNAGGPDRAWELASGTKSFCGVMAAAAVQDGLLAIDQYAADILPEWRSDPLKSRIKIGHLLSLTSGLANTDRPARPPTYADAIAREAVRAAGEEFEYGPVSFQAFGEALRRTIAPRDRDPVAYLTRRVLEPIGCLPNGWRRGLDGNPLLPQGAHFTARAWARFGQWVMEGGHGLVDAHALEQCFQGTHANPGYGLSWWLLRPGLIPPSRLRSGIEVGAEAAREDVRMAAGAGDQRLYLLPRRNVVIARQANGILRSLRARGDARWNDAVFLRLFETI